MTDAAARKQRLDTATAELDPPFALLDLDAMESNGRELARQAGPLPVRIASKSVRSRPVLERIFALGDAFDGVLAFTLPEALWLAEHGVRDVVVGYPSVDRGPIRALASLAAERPGDAPVVMVDCAEHLDLLARAAREARAEIGVCIDVDAGFRALAGRVRVGARRSPVRDAYDAKVLARDVASRPGLRLEGVMAYEGQVAGVGDEPPGRPLRGAAIRRMQAASLRELAKRLPEVVAEVEEVAAGNGRSLRFVNAGGTGSLERVGALGYATELTAGSGFYAPTLFDSYRGLDLTPAAMFCLPVVRRPDRETATLLGGGYIASGAVAPDRAPSPYLPEGLSFDRDEGAGEVQTPLRGEAARSLGVGDRVYLRHAKAGELCERFASLHLVARDRIVDEVPTYRGEGRTFL
ncbi:amino acid deaminase/aldolase [Thermoleophilia bacterium SCSIO 60948]|nr:amino acid deaminase/aldolase [Thermoleophilia bacterium SCSIO 60948]